MVVVRHSQFTKSPRLGSKQIINLPTSGREKSFGRDFLRKFEGIPTGEHNVVLQLGR